MQAAASRCWRTVLASQRQYLDSAAGSTAEPTSFPLLQSRSLCPAYSTALAHPVTGGGAVDCSKPPASQQHAAPDRLYRFIHPKHRLSPAAQLHQPGCSLARALQSYDGYVDAEQRCADEHQQRWRQLRGAACCIWPDQKLRKEAGGDPKNCCQQHKA
jgi:hypothetical protein